MYCPNCKDEYRDGYTTCPQCDSVLVEKIKIDENEPRECTPVFLCDAADDFEAEIIIGKLRTEGIYAYKKYRRSDSYGKLVFGRTILGVRIMVADCDLDEAKAVLEDGEYIIE